VTLRIGCRNFIRGAWIAWTVLLFATSGGCKRPNADAVPAPPPLVTVSVPIKRIVTEFVDFTGRTEAPYSVDIKARVTGYLVKMPFVEGTEVKTGDLLFEVDPRPYQAQLDNAQGQVGLNEARLKLARADNARAKNIAQMNAGAISKQDLDKYEASEEEAVAAVQASKANLESYRINLDFCKVTSPIDGRVSRYDITIGNLVNADQTLLTTVVSQDPIYVYYDVDELTLLSFLRRLMASDADPLTAKKFKVYMGLADEDGYPHEGYVNFANNVVNASTGTITVRGAFSNPDSPSKRRLLKPGMFVRVHFPVGEPHESLLVSEKALGTDQGRKYLLVVNDKNIVEYRPVATGPLQDDGLRVIEDGLKPDERVIVSGLQLVRPKADVRVEMASMPTTPIAGNSGKVDPISGKTIFKPNKPREPAAPSRPTATSEPKAGEAAKPSESVPASAAAASGGLAPTKASPPESASPSPSKVQPTPSGMTNP
jgi:multidrug efflux system membrane fusion protein